MVSPARLLCPTRDFVLEGRDRDVSTHEHQISQIEVCANMEFARIEMMLITLVPRMAKSLKQRHMMMERGMSASMEAGEVL